MAEKGPLIGILEQQEDETVSRQSQWWFGLPAESVFRREATTIKSDADLMAIFSATPSTVRVLLVDGELQLDIQRYMNPVTLIEQGVGATDALFKGSNNWQPFSILRRAFLKCLEERAAVIDTEKSALMVGISGATFMAIAALVQIGFSHFLICDVESSLTDRLLGHAKANYLGSQFEIIPPEELVLLPGSSSLLFNGVSGDENFSEIYELRYFNFLSRGGLVVNVDNTPFGQRVVNDAISFGYSVIDSQRLTAQRLSFLTQLLPHNQTKG